MFEMLEGKKIRIEVSQLPPASSSPNSRAYWANRFKDARIYQNAVFYECIDARNKLERLPWCPGFPPFKKPRLDLTFIFPNYRKRDEDSLRARFKPGQDALVQAGLFEDDSMEDVVMGEIKVEVDRNRAPLTIIELVESDEHSH